MQGSDGQTQIQRGNGGSALPVRADFGLEAHQKAPTLIAGESAGDHGPVEIWAPNRTLLWLIIVGCGAFGIYMLIPAFGEKPRDLFSTVFIGLIYLLSMPASIAALRRPPYLTTDNVGIGITTKKGCQALRWDQIFSADVSSGSLMFQPMIVLRAPDRVEINLTGFPRGTRNRLLKMITSRARLVPTAGGNGLSFHAERPEQLTGREVAGLMAAPEHPQAGEGKSAPR